MTESMLAFVLGMLIAELILLSPYFFMARAYRRGSYRQGLLWARGYYLTMGRILPRLRPVWALSICQLYIAMGEFDEALPYAEEAVAAYSGSRFRNQQALAKSCMGVILTRQGQFEQAERMMEESLAVAGSMSARATIEINASTTCINRGKIDEAIQLLDPHVNATRARPDSKAIAMNNRSLCHYLKGEIEEAVALSRLALEQQMQNPMVLPAIRISHTFYLAESGRIEEAREMEAKLHPHFARLQPHLQAAAYRSMSRLALARDNLDRARDCAEMAASLDMNPNAQAPALLMQAEVFAARHNLNRVAALCERVIHSDAIDFYKQKARNLMQQQTAFRPMAVEPSVEQQTLVNHLANS